MFVSVSFTRTCRSDGGLKRRTCTQANGTAACHQRCEIAARRQTQRNLNPNGEYGVTNELNARVPASTVHSMKTWSRANDLKRFVLSDVRRLKQIGDGRRSLVHHLSSCRLVVTHCLTSESESRSPHFVLCKPNKRGPVRLSKTSDSLIPQILYRTINSFWLAASGCSRVFNHRNRLNASGPASTKPRTQKSPRSVLLLSSLSSWASALARPSRISTSAPAEAAWHPAQAGFLASAGVLRSRVSAENSRDEFGGG